jgi:hypothetical protein
MIATVHLNTVQKLLTIVVFSDSNSVKKLFHFPEKGFPVIFISEEKEVEKKNMKHLSVILNEPKPLDQKVLIASVCLNPVTS